MSALTEQQFETLREDFREFLCGLGSELGRVASSPYRTREGAAAYLQCGVRTIDELLASGELPKKYRGTTPLIAVADLEALIDRETIAGKRRRSPFAKELVRKETEL